jgi:alpha-beta hydrolase superfamily lysophospholipase
MPHPTDQIALRLWELLPQASPGQESERVAASGRSQPVHFGSPHRPLFGWLHLPEKTPSQPVGLLICNPFGNEAICAHRTLRHLAESACRSGFPVLRFDYDGTGDSAGTDRDPERLQHWLSSLDQAANELRRLTGVGRLCLLGIRLGAALAASVAASRNDVEGLVAIAPVVSGKAYVRELRLLQKAMQAKRGESRDSSDRLLEAAGFVLTESTQSELSALDLKHLGPPAPRVLILERTEMPGDGGWSRHLEGRGTQVTRKAVPGYTEMMLDSHESIVPTEILDATLDWLGKLPELAEIAVQGPPARAATFAHAHGPIQEEAVWFGTGHPLFGIVTTAPGCTHHEGPRALLLINSGAVHRVGPNRLYVTLARHFALRGYVVLRMDISGLGDTAARAGAQENVVYSKHAMTDIHAALEYLRRQRGITHIHAMGLCSGAYNAFKAAVAALPLNAATLINPLTFFWKDGTSLKYAEHRVAGDIIRYRTNAFRLNAWLKLLRGKVDLWELLHVLARRIRSTALGPLWSVARLLHIPLKDDLPTELEAIVRHGIKLQFVFAEGDPGLELLSNHGGTTVRKLRSRGALDIQIIEAADHTFTDDTARAALLAALDR